MLGHLKDKPPAAKVELDNWPLFWHDCAEVLAQLLFGRIEEQIVT